MNISKHAALTLAILFVTGALFASHAGSLSTTFVIVTVEDLEIGGTAPIVLSDGRRYSVDNTSEREVEIELTAIKPSRYDLRKNKYEPLPDISWITINPTRLRIQSKGRTEADVKISIPDDPAYANRMYEFWLRAATSDQQFGVALVTRVRVHTIQKPKPPVPDKTTLKQN